MKNPRRAAASPAATVAVGVAAIVVVGAFLGGGLSFHPRVLAALAAILVVGCISWNVAVLGVPLGAASSLYFGALAVFHLGLIVPCEAGLVSPPPWLAVLSEELVSQSLLYALLSFCCLEVGLLAGWRRLSTRPPHLWPRPMSRLSANALHSGGLFLAVGAVCIALVGIVWPIGMGRFVSASYGYELYALTDSRVLQTGLFWLLPSASLVAFAGARKGIETKRALALSVGVILVLLWVGDRGAAVAFGATCLIVWTYVRGSLPGRVSLAAIVAFLLLMPTVAALRKIPRNKINVSTMSQAALKVSALSALTEMGGSVRPLLETLRLVPEQVPYRRGSSYGSAILHVIPNVGLSKAQPEWTEASSLPPNHWLTYTVAPSTYARFGGLGFSGVAEPYLNFGLGGIIVYFSILGFALGRVDLVLAQAPSRRALALAAVLFMPFLLTVRNDFHNFVRPAVWGVLLVLLVDRLHGVRKTYGSARGMPHSSPTTHVPSRQRRRFPRLGPIQQRS